MAFMRSVFKPITYAIMRTRVYIDVTLYRYTPINAYKALRLIISNHITPFIRLSITNTVYKTPVFTLVSYHRFKILIDTPGLRSSNVEAIAWV